MSVVFVGIVTGGKETAGDDAQDIEWVKLDEIESLDIAFDHKKIIRDYKAWQAGGGTFWSSKRRNV
jgi:ADP-ribose pyrophosphatase YjhB (NUDIX family)